MRTRFSLPMLAALCLFALAACAPRVASPVPATITPATTEPPTAIPPTETPSPTAVTSACPSAFAGYASWTKVNPAPIHGHETYVDVYVDDRAAPIYLAATGTFPECAAIVKTHLDGPTSTTVTAVTVMVKMPAGYDPAHNDWWWGMYGPDGTTELMSGRVEVCIACHLKAADADYVFSKDVLTQSGEGK